MRATVARTRACRISSVSSSSSKVTTSLMLRTPRFRSSPSAMISRMTMGEREMAFMTRICPRSMRLAISTSPSRVSSGTVPISRRYMRTGSLVFSRVPGERSSSTSSDSSPASCSSSRSAAPRRLSPESTSMPWVLMVVSRSSRSSGDVMSPGSRSLTSPKVRYPFSLPVSMMRSTSSSYLSSSSATDWRSSQMPTQRWAHIRWDARTVSLRRHEGLPQCNRGC